MALRAVAYPGGMSLNVLAHRAEPNKLPPDEWEKAYVEAILQHLQWGMVVYDIGAEEGEYTALWAKHAGAKNIHIIEPAPWYWPNIRAVWEANVQGSPGGCWMGFFADQGVHPAATDGWPKESRGELMLESAFACYAEHPHLPATTLDKYMRASLAPPDVICMDVEGAEQLVLMGATECLQEIRPEVFLALHHPDFLARYHASAETLFRLMDGLGYDARLIAHELHESHYQFTPRGRVDG